MARGWKGLVERAVAATAIPGWVQRWRIPSTVVLAYHNVVPRGERVAGERSLHVDQTDFAAQLDVLQSSHAVIPLADFDRSDSETEGRPRAIITFDDAYAGALHAGVEELERRGLPATFFVAPGFLGAEGFWWDLLAERGIDDVRKHGLWALQGRHDRIMDWAADRGRPGDRLPQHARPGDHAMLQRAARSPVITFGAHTWGHPNLAALAHAEVVEELSRSRDWLTEQSVPDTNWIAYPYGLTSSSVTAAAAAAGFDGALLITGGLAQAKGRRGPIHALPRMNVSRPLTLDGLRLRLAGLLS